MTEFQRQTVVLALKDLAEDSVFSICTIDKCLKVAGIPRPPNYDTLRAMHCVDYGKMPRGYREELLKQVAMIFGEHITPPIDQEKEENQLPATQANPNVSFVNALMKLIKWT